jgi:hypothetical protein
VAHPTLSTRPSAALTLLRDTAGRPPPRPARWSWAVMTLDSKGRVGLPPVARRALGAATGGVAVRAAARGAVLVLRADDDGNGTGAPLVVDGRGRVPLPVWWRRACVGGACAVATRTVAGVGETALVVVTRGRDRGRRRAGSTVNPR